jgi:hypothetical protein
VLLESSLNEDEDATNPGLEVWYLQGDRENGFPRHVLVAFRFDDFGDTTFQLPNGETIRFTPKERRTIKIDNKWMDLTRLGRVAAILEYKTFLFSETSDEAETADITERTIKCDVCETATITGSDAFFSSMGWLVKKNRIKCPECW